MNKILIPAVLGSIIVIAGIFAFMPIEKASTVHSNLITPSSLSDTDSNVDSEVDNQDRAIYFSLNFTHVKHNNVTVLPAGNGQYSGWAVLAGIPNAQKTSDAIESGANTLNVNCGLQTLNPSGAFEKIPNSNATGNSNSTFFQLDTNVLSNNDGIQLVLSNSSQTSGVCELTIILDSTTG